MTHNESLVDIAIVKDLNKLIRKQMKAINSTMKLHYPTKVSWAYDLDYCAECSNWEGRNPELLREYPCDTIKAIERELE